MKKYFILFIILSANLNFAQELESLYNKFVRQHSSEQNYQQQIEGEESKCGFGLVAEVKRNFDNFSDDQKKVLSKMMYRAEMQTSIVSPGGFFRIHFDTTGRNTPNYSVTDLAIEADRAYNYQVNQLGYLPPPSDGTEGGDDKYDVYIKDISDWGVTYPDRHLGDEKYTSYIQLDNNFDNKRTPGFDGAKITMAHEFHHAIQIGSYVFSEDFFYHEITSTSIEEFMYDDVNDYYFEMIGFFGNPNQSLVRNGNTSTPGYSRTVFNLFLEQKFDIDIIKKIWELMESTAGHKALPAIETAIDEYGSSFAEEFSQFGIWNYYTGSRAVPGKYYEEAIQYPAVINPSDKYTFYSRPYSKEMLAYAQPVSNFYFNYVDSSLAEPREITVVVSNSNIDAALDYNDFNTEQFTLEFSTSYSDGYEGLFNYYTMLTSENESVFDISYIIRGKDIDTSSIPGTNEEIDFVFPQPFAYSRYNEIFLPCGDSPDGVVELKIFSLGMTQVYSDLKSLISKNSKKVVAWDGYDSSNRKLSTGVYFYVTQAGDNLKKGKFVIYND